MDKGTNKELFNILSDLEGEGIILEDTENLLSIFDRSFSDIIRWTGDYKETYLTLARDSMKELYSLLNVIRTQLSGTSKRIRYGVEAGYTWDRENRS